MNEIGSVAEKEATATIPGEEPPRCLYCEKEKVRVVFRGLCVACYSRPKIRALFPEEPSERSREEEPTQVSTQSGGGVDTEEPGAGGRGEAVAGRTDRRDPR